MGAHFQVELHIAQQNGNLATMSSLIVRMWHCNAIVTLRNYRRGGVYALVQTPYWKQWLLVSQIVFSWRPQNCLRYPIRTACKWAKSVPTLNSWHKPNSCLKYFQFSGTKPLNLFHLILNLTVICLKWDICSLFLWWLSSVSQLQKEAGVKKANLVKIKSFWISMPTWSNRVWIV